MSKIRNVSLADGFSVLRQRASSSVRGYLRFYWDLAAQLIFSRGAKNARAGLAEDWGCTSGRILEEGVPVPREDTYTYLSSSWATPLLVLDGEEIECSKPGEGSGEYWPESARAILDGVDKKTSCDDTDKGE